MFVKLSLFSIYATRTLQEEQKALVDVGGKESVHGVATRVRGSYGVSSTTSSRTVTPPREGVTPPRAVSRPRTPPLVDL